MTSQRISGVSTLAAPLLVVPLMASTVINQVDIVPEFVRGVVTGAAIALMLGYCLIAGTELSAKKPRDEQKLRDLDPLRDLPRKEDQQ